MVPAEELLERIQANGYKHGEHLAEDSIKDNLQYVRKTLKKSEVGIEKLWDVRVKIGSIAVESISWRLSSIYKSLQMKANWFFDGPTPLRVCRS